MDAVYGNFCAATWPKPYRLGRWREAAEFSTRGLEWDPRGPIPIVSPLSLATVAIDRLPTTRQRAWSAACLSTSRRSATRSSPCRRISPPPRWLSGARTRGRSPRR
jgi:hypothetical protein